MADYFRPIPQSDPGRPAGAPRLAGGWCWFDRVEHLRRDRPPEVLPVSALPAELFERLTAPRLPLLGLTLDRPRVMGIVNVTPDSFSDGGRWLDPGAALAQVEALAAEADLIDVGAESTRPGSGALPLAEEVERLEPVLAGLAQRPGLPPVSIDTRKAAVARLALASGASLVNDVSGLAHDPEMAPLVAAAQVPVVIMHSPDAAGGLHRPMRGQHLLLDLFDALEAALTRAEAAGIPRSRIVLDPGIGFGKAGAQNLAVLARVSLFHGLGCPLLVGASRKRFVGQFGARPGAGEPEVPPEARLPGSLAVALAAVGAGVQFVRVHDAAETAQALRLAMALRGATGVVEQDGSSPEARAR